MLIDVYAPTVLEIIGAVGVVLNTLLTTYLVLRVRLSTRDDVYHRQREEDIHQALVRKLKLEIENLEEDCEAESNTRKAQPN